MVIGSLFDRFFALLEALLFGFLLLTPLILTMREQKEYRFVKKNLKKQDIVEFIKIVDGFTNKSYRLGAISAFLEKQGLVASPDNIQRLRILIACVQSSLASEYSAQNFNQLVNIDKELAHALGYVDENTNKIANHWDEDQLDLLCKYLEQLQQLSGKST